MTTMAFDTLQYANRLKAPRFSERQAEVQAEAFAKVIDEKLATKHDLNMAVLRLELKLAELKSELINAMLKTILSVSVAQATVIIACIKFIH